MSLRPEVHSGSVLGARYQEFTGGSKEIIADKMECVKILQNLVHKLSDLGGEQEGERDDVQAQTTLSKRVLRMASNDVKTLEQVADLLDCLRMPPPSPPPSNMAHRQSNPGSHATAQALSEGFGRHLWNR